MGLNIMGCCCGGASGFFEFVTSALDGENYALDTEDAILLGESSVLGAATPNDSYAQNGTSIGNFRHLWDVYGLADLPQYNGFALYMGHQHAWTFNYSGTVPSPPADDIVYFAKCTHEGSPVEYILDESTASTADYDALKEFWDDINFSGARETGDGKIVIHEVSEVTGGIVDPISGNTPLFDWEFLRTRTYNGTAIAESNDNLWRFYYAYNSQAALNAFNAITPSAGYSAQTLGASASVLFSGSLAGPKWQFGDGPYREVIARGREQLPTVVGWSDEITDHTVTETAGPNGSPIDAVFGDPLTRTSTNQEIDVERTTKLEIGIARSSGAAYDPVAVVETRTNTTNNTYLRSDIDTGATNGFAWEQVTHNLDGRFSTDWLVFNHTPAISKSLTPLEFDTNGDASNWAIKYQGLSGQEFKFNGYDAANMLDACAPAALTSLEGDLETYYGGSLTGVAVGDFPPTTWPTHAGLVDVEFADDVTGVEGKWWEMGLSDFRAIYRDDTDVVILRDETGYVWEPTNLAGTVGQVVRRDRQRLEIWSGGSMVFKTYSLIGYSLTLRHTHGDYIYFSGPLWHETGSAAAKALLDDGSKYFATSGVPASAAYYQPHPLKDWTRAPRDEATVVTNPPAP